MVVKFEIGRKREKKSSISVQESEDGRKDSRKNGLLGLFKRVRILILS